VIFSYNVIGNGDRLQLSISEIPVKEIKSNKNNYIVNVTNKKLTLKIEITKHLFNSKKGKVTGHCFSFKRQKSSDFYQFSYKVNIDRVLKNHRNGQLSIRYLSNRGIKVVGKLAVSQEEIIQMRDKQKLNYRPRKKGKNNALKNARKRAKGKNVQKMVEALNRYELKNKNNFIDKKADAIDNSELRKKSIQLKDPHTKNRCAICVYYIGNKCTYHNVRVTKYHGCYKFRSYKIVYGGGFSPR